MMALIYILLVLSILLNLLFLIFDVIPYLVPDFKRKFRKYKSEKIDIVDIEKKILDVSLEIIKKKKSIMTWHPSNLYLSFQSRFRGRVSTEFKNYNYPRAYLMYGISDYLIKTKNEVKLAELKRYFDKYYISDNGQPRFIINKVDQAVFGIVAINLYSVYKEDKYRTFVSIIFEFISINYSKNKIVLYRENTINELNDTIGMIVPFLVRYYEFLKNPLALKIARNQLTFFIEYGTDMNTYLPSHGINRKNGIKIGSNNWGRGIGWFFIGLKDFYEISGEFEEQYLGLCNTVLQLKNNEGLWGQFPGSDDTFDASSSTLIIYSLPPEEYNMYKVLNLLSKYISKEGFILQTSGDTERPNSYSKVFGKSELSQGILLLILGKYKN
ncbi:MAG: glycoside hydrolase family 88 protein [Proteiniphilum sp.]|uniref:glycoside hydrolase family 88 protein n=1 Tax=Proteiniphilum sp. TaxID=1926877 RepID=UPI002B202A3F|nr:glycoside hydrolase family 88 protein [Proteiniphilum sp.]MEA5129457.1 glycoside hydrolase family 88 protein [Proteiniphilum sp.]